jgi:uncharacterized damage-inducible protein DinB
MKNLPPMPRRGFLKSATLLATASVGFSAMPLTTMAESLPPDDRDNVIGPRTGFSPQVGTLLSMMTWMRRVILRPVRGMTVEQLDFLNDDQSNSIGSMLLHLAATERFYQINTFDGKRWGDWPDKDQKRFGVAMSLGAEARKKIKGQDLNFYLSTLQEVRENTISEFKKREDDWLFSVDEKWGWGPTNNYCKWFHVCEHESNHNGQIKYIKSRLPGAKASND